MRMSLNAVEANVFDFVIMNFSGKSTGSPGNSDPSVVVVHSDEYNRKIKLEIGRINTLTVGDFFNEDGSDDDDVISELAAICTPTLAMQYLSNQIDGEEPENEDDDVVAEAIINNSCSTLAKALHDIHFSDADGYDIDEPNESKHRLHIFCISSPDADIGNTYFGMLARRDTETDETIFSLVFTQALPFYTRADGSIRIAKEALDTVVDETYARTVLGFISNVLPSDLLEKSTLDNLLIGYSDISTEDDDVVERIYEASELGDNAFTNEYTAKDGINVISSYAHNVGEDGATSIMAATVITPLDPDLVIASVKEIENFNFADLFERNIVELDIFLDGDEPGEDEKAVMAVAKSVVGMTKH